MKYNCFESDIYKMTMQIYFDEKEVFTGLIIEILVECILLIYDEYFDWRIYMVKVYCNY